jgi:HPr kinase/phosphorylase
MQTIHGCALNIYNTGVIITGDSAVGKSELALQLLDRGHKFIADDLIVLNKSTHTENNNNEVIHEVIISAAHKGESFLHVRGLGFINISRLYGMFNVMPCCRLDLIIDLKQPQPSTNLQNELDEIIDIEKDPLTQLINEVDILGASIMQMQLLINPCRPLALLIETMVKYNNQRQLGYDSHQDFLTHHAELLRLTK